MKRWVPLSPKTTSQGVIQENVHFLRLALLWTLWIQHISKDYLLCDTLLSVSGSPRPRTQAEGQVKAVPWVESFITLSDIFSLCLPLTYTVNPSQDHELTLFKMTVTKFVMFAIKTFSLYYWQFCIWSTRFFVRAICPGHSPTKSTYSQSACALHHMTV